LSWALDHVGPMARSAADAAIILSAIAGLDPRDETSSGEPVPDYVAMLNDTRLNGLRIGVPRQYFFDSVDAEVLEAVRGAISAFEALGAQVSDIDLPHITEAPAAVNAIMLPEALAYHQRWLAERPQDYGEELRGRLETGLLYPAVSYVQAQRLRSLIVDEWRQNVFGNVDLLATPTTPVPAPSLDEAALQTTLNLVRFTNPFNLTGVPAISIPCGFTTAGLPIGLQLAGRWFDEGTVLRAAHAYQQATDWHTRRPAL
jgi:aspartyl-tRNA(Asn)/glutamyl-tRNA(Gln) amidotransferase subunit A